MSKHNIDLAWATVPNTLSYTNFGDALSAIITVGLSNTHLNHTGLNSENERLAAIGTIGHNLKNGIINIWGTGFDASINPSDISINRYQRPKNTKFNVYATRGRFSELLLKSQGIETQSVYGDPAWFSKYLISVDVPIKYELGIIVHLSELETHGLDAIVKNEMQRYKIPVHLQGKIKIINTYAERSVQGVLNKIREIKSCKRILSTSLHGLVISEMFNIPCAWFGFSDKGGIKSPLYVYSENSIDHRVRDFYSSTDSHDYVLAYHTPRNLPFNYDLAIEFLDKEWVPVIFNELKLFNAFPYRDPNINHPMDMNISNIRRILENIPI